MNRELNNLLVMLEKSDCNMVVNTSWGYNLGSKRQMERSVMRSDLNALLFGDFTPDQRDIDLHERLSLYYKQTPDEMDNRTAMGYWKEFKQWCSERGYTQEEINRAKRNVRI